MAEEFTIRPACGADLDEVEAIYLALHEKEARGEGCTGWLPGVYPVRATAEAALEKGHLYVLVSGGKVCASARINSDQEPAYAQVDWVYPAAPEQVLVIHTLTVNPAAAGHGFGSAFVRWYEQEARRRGCTALRLDTNGRNLPARRLYAHLGYRESGIIPTVFNGIPDVNLVCLEKQP